MKKYKYDLEERTYKFAKDVVQFVNKTQKTVANIEIVKQLIRSAASVGANYIEANEALSKKDFIYRIKLCRKESKETVYWIKLLDIDDKQAVESNKLIQESEELSKIFEAFSFRNNLLCFKSHNPKFLKQI